MGIFEKLGRQVEQFKQTAKQTAEENTTYQCQTCGEQLDTQHDQCPECGSKDITPLTAEE